MIYVVQVNVELEAATPELAEDLVLNMLEEDITREGVFFEIKKVSELT